MTHVLPALVLLLAIGRLQPADAPVERAVLGLEARWNEAHLKGDVPVLDALCADQLIVTVPGMTPMTKADILGFWRSGRAKITRYETTDIRVAVYTDTAIVTGHLHRTRDFNGKVLDDRWRYTKTYSRQGQTWRVVAYHASNADQ
ncbi:MAG: nuclear transport factor 2 family protein [Chloroflexi bacterium]|nr:nuclear transport factor 2 family protein [Chloroflexota bacterium]